MSTALAIQEPTSLVAVHDQCEAIEAWAERCDSVPELRDAVNKCAAITEYLTRTSTEGRERVAAAMRRLEVRIGTLLGPATPNGKGLGSSASDPGDLTPNERHAFRKMAAHPDVVEDVIANSTDNDPASRRKVQAAIAERTAPAEKPRRSSLPDAAASAGWEFRKAVERLERIVADDRFAANARQVAEHLSGHLSYAIEVCQDLYILLNKES